MTHAKRHMITEVLFTGSFRVSLITELGVQERHWYDK